MNFCNTCRALLAPFLVHVHSEFSFAFFFFFFAKNILLQISECVVIPLSPMVPADSEGNTTPPAGRYRSGAALAGKTLNDFIAQIMTVFRLWPHTEALEHFADC